MKLRKKKPALILIDIQKAFLDEEYWGGNRNNKNAEIICGKILNKWRELNLPLFHIRHSSTSLKSKLHQSNKGFEFNENVMPIENEPIITKDVNSAFIGTDLKEQLDKDPKKVVIKPEEALSFLKLAQSWNPKFIAQKGSDILNPEEIIKVLEDDEPSNIQELRTGTTKESDEE